jgi:hypothetical protein
MSDDLTIEYLPGDDGSATPAGPGSPDAPPGPRRKRLLVIGLLVLLAVAGVAGAQLIGPGPAPDPRAATGNGLPAPGTALRIQLDRAGFSGPPGGSLAGDDDVLEQIRERVVALAVLNDHALSTPGQVIVLYAGDLGSGRYAGVLYPQTEGWSRAVLTGPAGAAPHLLTEAGWADDSRDLVSTLTDAHATFVNRPGGGAVLVTAPAARGVEIASARQFLPGGQVRTTWRPLRKRGSSVWARQLTPSELYLAEYRTTNSDSDLYPEVVDPPDGHAAARAIATGSAAGSPDGQEALDCAADQAQEAGASLAERPALAPVTTLGNGTTIGAVVLRSPDGGWLWGLCAIESGADTSVEEQYPGNGVARARWTDPGQVTVALPVVEGESDGDPRFLVLTPAGADHVRIDGVTVTVHDRLAEVRLTHGASLTDTTIEALRAGRVISRTTPAATN